MAETTWFYVHRYGHWHIAQNAEFRALCGETPQLPYWNSQMKFRDYDPRLEADERQVCGPCLLLLPAVPSEENND